MELSADTLDMGELGRKRKKSMTVLVSNKGKRTLRNPDFASLQ